MPETGINLQPLHTENYLSYKITIGKYSSCQFNGLCLVKSSPINTKFTMFPMGTACTGYPSK